LIVAFKEFKILQVPLKYQNGGEKKAATFLKAMLDNKSKNKFFLLSVGKWRCN
jgi:hypothetical protein